MADLGGLILSIKFALAVYVIIKSWYWRTIIYYIKLLVQLNPTISLLLLPKGEFVKLVFDSNLYYQDGYLSNTYND
jgi:hypothetical protein